MERLVAPSHLHDPSSSPNTQSNWSSTLPHQPRSNTPPQQQHTRSRSNSGREPILVSNRETLLNTSNRDALHNTTNRDALLNTTNRDVLLNTNTSTRETLLNTSTDSATTCRGNSTNDDLISAAPPPANFNTPSSHNINTTGNFMPTSQHQQPQHNTSFSSNTSNLNTSFGAVSTSSVGGLNISAGGFHQIGGMEQKKEVKLNTIMWFYGRISRDAAEQLLLPREDGLFLVRESTNFPGDYTLCVCYQAKVEHYRVIYKNNQLTIDEDEFFDSLTKLVEHYEHDADGLCTRLACALPKQGSEEYRRQTEATFRDAGWDISRKDLTLGDSIGKGEFGEVLLGNWRGTKVAVKRLKSNWHHLFDEASLMTRLQHDNLVALLGLVFEESSILLVTEYMSKGSLVDYLRSRGRLHVTKLDQIMFACDTASGMAYLESRSVVHRDLAARNVLISQDHHAKVCDFGMAKDVSGNIDGGKFPIKWTAPEALRHNIFSSKSDMWSFGILLWEIYSFGRVPYPKIPVADVMRYVEKDYRMEVPDNCPEDIYTIMQEAWNLVKERRPTFEEVKRRLLELKLSTPA